MNCKLYNHHRDERWGYYGELDLSERHSCQVVQTSQLHITGFITMALFQPMHGAAIHAVPIPTALIYTVCTLTWYGVVTLNWE